MRTLQLVSFGIAAPLCATACGSSHAVVDAPARDTGAAADSSTDAPLGHVLRSLDGAAHINADWSATENGVTFPPVKDGMPQMPSIVLDDVLGQVL